MNTDAFLIELSNLCRKHRVGISGQPIIYVLEPEDFGFDYSIDAESRLCLGKPESDAASGARRNS